MPVNIAEVHYDIAWHKIRSCHDTTSYTRDDLENMQECSAFILDTLSEINKNTVIVKNFIGVDVKIVISIDDIKFHHNMMLVYVTGLSRDYVKDYVSDAVKTWNEKYDIKDDNKRWRGIKNGSDGWGHSIVYCYDSYNVKL